MTAGVAWASGINLYATILVLGGLGMMGDIQLPPALAVLDDPLVMGAAGFMYMVEFCVDKIPGLDTGWDTLHTFIRIPAGAVLAVSAVGGVDPAVQVAAAVLGGGFAAGTHLGKSGFRVMLNALPEPFSNWLTSLGEDMVVVAGLLAAIWHPLFFLAFLALCLAAMLCLLPVLWRGVSLVLRSVVGKVAAGKGAPGRK